MQSLLGNNYPIEHKWHLFEERLLSIISLFFFYFSFLILCTLLLLCVRVCVYVPVAFIRLTYDLTYLYILSHKYI
ncbi:hypothetical protein AB4K20DRAFT_1002058 [Rhizopus microsporus]